MNIDDVIDALAEVIESSTGIRCSPFVDNPVLPAVMIYPDDIGGESYYKTMKGGTFELPLIAQVVCSAADVAGQQRFLNAAISPDGDLSIPRAVLDHPTLGSAPDENTGHPAASMSATVTRVTDYGIASMLDGKRVLQARIAVKVLTKGVER
jgi:hypothetical protein